MSSNTKIVVLHLKELIYTGIFAILGILFVILLVIMFIPRDKKETSSSDVTPTATYVPGVYTTSLILNDKTVDVEVTVDETNINDIQMINLDDAVATMFPLLEPSFDDLAGQILRSQSLESITYADDNKYTSMVLLNAIKASLEKAAAPSPSSSASPGSPSPVSQ